MKKLFLLVAMHGRFRTFTAYAEATFEQSFLSEEIEDTYVVFSLTFESSNIESLGTKNLK